MRTYKFFTFLLALLFVASLGNAQKFDTTVTMQGQGYRVSCSNKDVDNNAVTIAPVKINELRQLDFPIKGKILKAAIDDLNDDGLPDIVICVYTGNNGEIGNIISATFDKPNKTMVPIIFPDIYNDPKLREGYKGYDVFSLVIGTLIRKFPIYLPTDAVGKPTGGIRTIQYKAMPGERGMLSFKVLRTFDTKPEE